MDCPSCSEPLIVVEREGIELDYCPKCKGLWFDADELELLNEALKLDAALPDMGSLSKAVTTEKGRKCPRCGKRMEKVYMGEKPPIVIDRCRNGHGLWFESGELGQAIRQYLSTRTQLKQFFEDAKAGEKHVIRFLGEVLSGTEEGKGGGKGE